MNRLLAEDKGCIVYDGGWINSMLGDGNLSVVEYLNDRQEPREKRYLYCAISTATPRPSEG